MALGAGRSTADAQTAAAINGDELAAMGINWNFAPVADVNVNPANPVIGVRSFGENPRLVANLTAAQTRGYTAAGVAGAAKHFPGHGDTADDSHTRPPGHPPHPRGVGARWTGRRSRPPSTRACPRS